MKRFEHYIETQRDKADSLEPDEGHFIRFQEKLNRSNFRTSKWLIRLAAAILIAAFVSVNFLHFKIKSKEYLPVELRETAYYYNLRSENLWSEIRNSRKMDNSEKQVILNDMRNFEKEYKTILKDLKKFPGDERLVNAFIDYHRSKAEFLEEVVNQLNVTNLITI